jgi:hypothetical protein
MSDEDFLKRWSRRKRDVAKAEQAPPLPASDAAPKEPAPAAEKTEVQFDPASLPPLESINALSDVTAFLREGVPAELTRAALRRVWTADPAIRDFVGLAENAWDFTDPNAMPGFGPLEATEEVRQMIARVVGEIGKAAPSEVAEASEVRPKNVENSNHSNAIVDEQKVENLPPAASPEEELKQNAAQGSGKQVLLHSTGEDIAPQHDLTEAQEKPKQFSHRTHGGALPQ